MKYLRPLLAAALLCAVHLPAHAATPPGTPQAQPHMTAEQLLASLKPQHGTIELPGGIATLTLNGDFYYLSPEDTERVLNIGWGNPPGIETLGMIVPKATNPLSERGWGVIVSYQEDGHISDDDAAKIDYGQLLKDMQAEDEDDNKQRREQGYDGISLVGWAEPPHYDGQTHKIYWAKELRADHADINSLNYSIRVLGRKGVLELNAVATMNDLPTIKRELPQVMRFADFTDGNRYADYSPATDKLASYGLAALVAGGVASKAGLFAKLGVLLLAFKKFIIVGVVAVGAFLRKLFKRNG
ncbi:MULTISPECIES: DUF2167 domain-containing protein [Pseudomonas]|uniref:DUF2167 domain-containing protein n=1 Tax=Pseudomonas eucalypticola TaxID=2599595 RepID=A0A7D5H5S4_9PSED|nr:MULTISPECIES: DUF2167 domain-containing protein [Pseudomonas]QKZ03724.1 DUF2167 domain-containing protein [Pseudomonas eucalypticola]